MALIAFVDAFERRQKCQTTRRLRFWCAFLGFTNIRQAYVHRPCMRNGYACVYMLMMSLVVNYILLGDQNTKRRRRKSQTKGRETEAFVRLYFYGVRECMCSRWSRIDIKPHFRTTRARRNTRFLFFYFSSPCLRRIQF